MRKILVIIVMVLAGIAYFNSRKTVPAYSAPSHSGYVNPLAGEQWIPQHTDQGVDYNPVTDTPVRAIGDGVVVYSSTTDCYPPGWPGCAVIGYKLTSGRAKDAVIYVAEHLRNLLPAGAPVHPGEQIAIAIPGYPDTEWGWADCSGSGPVVHYNGAPDGTPMAGGLAFARFMRSLGASTQQDPGSGPDVIRC